MYLSDKIKEVVKIEELVNRLGYEINRSGFCLSPYKQENTPSCKIYPPSNSFYDFSSGEHGSAIDFYMAVYGTDFNTAVKELGDLYGLTSNEKRETGNERRETGNERRETGNEKREKASSVSRLTSYDCMSDDERIIYEERVGIADEKQALVEVQKYRIERNSEIFEDLYLYCTERGWSTEAWKYMNNERMLSSRTVLYFKLFFINNYWETNNHLKKRFPMADLQRSGLFNTKIDKKRETKDGVNEGNLIFWNHRLIIPYLHNKKIVYLRGRYFDSDNNTRTTSNKYLGLKNDALGVNTPKRFYNQDALINIVPGEKIYITEGEFDAMLLEDLGRRAIAIPGICNLPKAEKFRVLKDAEVVVCPDNDEAGQKMLDGIQKIFLDLGKEVFVKRFGEKDVTDFVRSITINELIEEVGK